jgi:uncharacterized protein (DUF433 family)
MTSSLRLADSSLTIEPGRGVYDARRAAALAGIPLRTLNDWAQKGFFSPSISPRPRVRLWSWSDLVALRAIDWLRRTKRLPDVPTVPFRSIRHALQELEKDGLSRDAIRTLAISPRGELFLASGRDVAVRATPDRQTASPEILHLVAPYPYGAGGPDLLEPRPLLRIIPGKLHGEPHVLDTRIPSAALFSLHRSGYSDEQVLEMYPDVSRQALREAIDLEQTLHTSAV